MQIRKLSLLNFKNIPQADLELSAGINCFTGLNGAGKTNVIDAIWYLSMCKSSLQMTDSQSVRHGEDFFMLSGEYLRDDGRHETVTCAFRRSGGKTLRRGGKEYEKLSDHIGHFPAVMVSPADIFLISDAADERRRWLNSFISQDDRPYLDALIRYNHALGERNKLLKQPPGTVHEQLLDVLDMQLAAHGEHIHKSRKALIQRLAPIVGRLYAAISGDCEEVSLSYRSELNDAPAAELLAAARRRDLELHYTTSGVHRDDMTMQIGGHPLKKYGSQGQQKSFLIALKLAQHILLAEGLSEKPVLLLDDLFDKLDAGRLGALIRLVGDGSFGQTIISDCNRERLTSILDDCGSPYALFEVREGEITREQ